MRIAVYGATGMIGSQIVAEALARGHEVTGVTRSGGELPAGVVTLLGDAADTGLTKRIASEADVVVSAIGPSRTGGDRREFLARLRNLAESLGGARLLVVGGAGSLLVDGQRLVDHADFPEIYRAESLIGAESLDYLRGLSDDVDWTYLSPAPVIQPGERTGRYRVALDSPAGESISAADYAIAMLDEIDQPAHRRQRFTVAS